MNRHFRPEPYREAYRRYDEKQDLKKEPPPPEPPYTIYWWRRTKPWEKTVEFFISFKGAPGRDQVYECLAKVFPGVRVFANGPWYVVELGQEYTWGEVVKVTALALKDLNINVAG